MRLILAATTLLVSSGCLDFGAMPKEMTIAVNVEKGGAGSIRIDARDIFSSKQGEESKKQIEEFIQDFKKRNWTEAPDGEVLEAPFSGCTQIVQEIGYDDQGHLNAFVQGWAPDVFVLFRSLDSSNPHALRRDGTFSLEWNGDVLSVKQGHRSPLPSKPPADDTPELPARIAETPKPESSTAALKIVITTEGEFLSATPGEISADRKTLIISGEPKEWAFSIRGLAK